MNAIAPAFGCVYGGLPFEDALKCVVGLVEDPLPAEYAILTYSVGRILAQDFDAQMNLPAFDQSAMDGYAVHCADLTAGGWLPIIGRTAAGEAPCVLAQGSAHRILTGAALPSGADAVIAQEDVRREASRIHVAVVPSPGMNVRRRGEDIRRGDELLAAGTLLDWRHLTVLAAQGLAGIRVRRRPKVVLLSGGQELRGLGESLTAGQSRDTNMPMLAALLTAWGAHVRPMPIMEDSPAAVGRALEAAAVDADLILSTGGISVGDEDHVRDALRALGGHLPVLKVAMKPGKPLAAGKLGNAVFIGLPGNPMAALTGTVAIVRPLLARMTGTAPAATIRAHASFDMHRKPGRTEFVPVSLHQQDASVWAARVGPDGSGRLGPLLAATGFAVLSAQDADIHHGAMLDILPFMPSAAETSREMSYG